VRAQLATGDPTVGDDGVRLRYGWGGCGLAGTGAGVGLRRGGKPVVQGSLRRDRRRRQAQLGSETRDLAISLVEVRAQRADYPLIITSS